MAKEVLILGAGPAGLACAWELHLAGRQFLVIEKQDNVGGLAKTLEFIEDKDIFRTDFGPHRFFSKNHYLYEFIEDLIGQDWLLVKRQTQQFIEGKFYDYPINFTQALKNIGLVRSLGILTSYFKATAYYKIWQKPINNFEDYLLSNFGRQLAQFNMLNYSEKLWGMPCSEIHPDWGKQRIKGLNITAALKNALCKKSKANTPKTLVDSFYYPKHGTGQIYQTISQKISEGASQVLTKTYPVKITHQDGRLEKIFLTNNQQKITIENPVLVSSIPITHFVSLLEPSAPNNVLEAARGLKWRAMVCLFLTLDKERVTNDNWIYFPDKAIPFTRVSEMKNFSQEMSPKDKTSLFIEFLCDEEDLFWQKTSKEIFDVAMPHLEAIGLCKASEVRHYYLIKQSNAYPVYTLSYLEKLKIVKDYLSQFDNLFLIGRPGRFKYTNQDHSLEMGILTAHSILENKRRDLDKVDSEEDYFEDGYLSQSKYAPL